MERFVVDKKTKKYKFMQGVCIFGLLFMWLIPYKCYTTGEEGWTYEKGVYGAIAVALCYLLTIVMWMIKIRNLKIIVDGNNIEIYRRGKMTIKTTIDAIDGFETLLACTSGKYGVDGRGLVICVDGERIELVRILTRNFDIFLKYLDDNAKFLKHTWYLDGKEVDKSASWAFKHYADEYFKEHHRVI